MEETTSLKAHHPDNTTGKKVLKKGKMTDRLGDEGGGLGTHESQKEG